MIDVDQFGEAIRWLNAELVELLQLSTMPMPANEAAWDRRRIASLEGYGRTLEAQLALARSIPGIDMTGPEASVAHAFTLIDTATKGLHP